MPLLSIPSTESGSRRTTVSSYRDGYRLIVGSHEPKMTTRRAHLLVIHASLCVRRNCGEPHQTPMTSKKMFAKCFVLQQTISENSFVACALVHVATLPREWIAVLSSRTKRESDKRCIRMFDLGRCRFAAAALLLLCCCGCCFSDCCISTAMLYLVPFD